MVYFWRDWVRIIGAFFTSLVRRQVTTNDQKLAWMIVWATVPVGIAGVLFEHEFRVLFGKPVLAAVFLVVNGVILYAGERFRPRKSRQADVEVQQQRATAALDRRKAEQEGGPPRRSPAHASGQVALRSEEIAVGMESDERLTKMTYRQAIGIGSAQILALLAGISRDGVTMVTGMFSGLSREDSARFAFLLATPVILAAGVLKVPDLIKLGHGIYGQILAGSVLSGVGAYLSVRYLIRYFRTRTLTPFAIYCFVFGLGSIIYLQVK
jgi:undecaprenyl-diphosphatase